MDVAAVVTAQAVLGTDDDSLDDFALLHSAAGSSLTDRSNDYVADVAVLALGAAQNTDALNFLGAGIIGNLQVTFLLNHRTGLLTSLFR